jgi:hypothetical protein
MNRWLPLLLVVIEITAVIVKTLAEDEPSA